MAEAHKDYSGTPLWKKLGIREGSRVHVGGEVPVGFYLGASAPPFEQLTRPGKDMDVVLFFSTSVDEIDRRFEELAKRMHPAGRL